MEGNLDKLNTEWDKRMSTLAQPEKQTDPALLLAYRNSIVCRAAMPPRLDDINARFLIEGLQEKIADAVREFDEKRKAL